MDGRSRPKGDRMNKFLIVIPTHNRNAMLNDAIESVQKQEYQNWALLVSDNASETRVAESITEEIKNAQRVSILRHDNLMTGTEHGEYLFRKSLDYEYDYLLMLADDDILLPNALALVESLCADQPCVCTSFVSYFQKDSLLRYERPSISTPPFTDMNSRMVLASYAREHGIILDDNTREDPAMHPIGHQHASCYFVSKGLLQQVLAKYSTICVTPFGDTGYHKFSMESGYIRYITKPAAVIRFHESYGMIGLSKGHRHDLSRHHDTNFKYSPVKGISFSNGVVNSYLALLHELKITYKRLSAIFILRHIREILADKPYDRQTFRALFEALTLFSPESIYELPATMLSGVLNRKSTRGGGNTICVHDIRSIWNAAAYCSEHLATRNTDRGVLFN